jgi:hypothetical protein
MNKVDVNAQYEHEEEEDHGWMHFCQGGAGGRGSAEKNVVFF